MLEKMSSEKKNIICSRFRKGNYYFPLDLIIKHYEENKIPELYRKSLKPHRNGTTTKLTSLLKGFKLFLIFLQIPIQNSIFLLRLRRVNDYLSLISRKLAIIPHKSVYLETYF